MNKHSAVTIVNDCASELKNCPDGIIVIAANTSAPSLWPAPIATDNCGSVNATSTNFPGDLFPIGTTEVTFKAIIGSDCDSAPCTFKATLIPPGDCVAALNTCHYT